MSAGALVVFLFFGLIGCMVLTSLLVSFWPPLDIWIVGVTAVVVGGVIGHDAGRRS